MTERLEMIFHGDLPRFLRRRARRERVTYPLNRRSSIKDIIESLGVPHTEIGAILCDGNEADFGLIPEGDHFIDVYPLLPPLDLTQQTRLRPFSWKTLGFVVDENTGKLASLLRLLGYDTRYQAGICDRVIAAIAEEEKRVVLSRDQGLFKRKNILHGRYLRTTHPYAQLRETLLYYGQNSPAAFLSRCVRCNTPLEPIEKAAIIHKLEPNTIKYHTRFKTCPDCQNVFWEGSHCQRLVINMRKAGILVDPHTGHARVVSPPEPPVPGP